MPAADRYTHGHSDAVLRSHRWRTAENSAGYLLPHLHEGDRVLDVGCGPGTITLDLAPLVPDGSVLGIDSAAAIVEEAEAARSSAGAGNVRFVVGDAYAIDSPDGTFDVVHAHQVLQHLSDPVRALVEMRRVLREDGVVAVRDSDYGAFAWAPHDEALVRWNAIYHGVTARNGAEADAGRHLLGWVRRAGFRNAQASSSTWTFADDESRAWWGELWADRVRDSALTAQALEYGLSDRTEMQAIADAWLAWSRHPEAVFIAVHGEVLARC